MANSTSHYQDAAKILTELEPIVSGPGGNAQVKATAAVAHALLAIEARTRTTRSESLRDLGK